MASPFFYVQNHEVPIRKDSVSVTQKITGDFTPAYNGAPLTTIQHFRRNYSMKTPLITTGEGRFLMALLEGKGHTWNFDENITEPLYSSKGLFATAATFGNATRYTTTSKFGPSGIEIGAGDEVEFDVGYLNEWTAMVWTGSDLTTATHYIVNSQGQKWVDGVRNDGASTPFITMLVTGIFRLGDTASVGVQRFDDLVVINEDISAEWAEDLGVMASAFSSLPKLKCHGAVTLGRTFNFWGSEASYEVQMGTIDGTYYNDLMAVSFALLQDDRV